MNLLDLSDDCLIYVCRHLDAESIVALSETCERLKNIAEANFKYFNSYLGYIDSTENERKAVNTIHKMGKYLHNIGLMFEPEYRCADAIFKTLAESVSENLIELYILGEICYMSLGIIAPILSQLQILSIQNSCRHDDCITSIDLPPLCPNLLQLTVSGQVEVAPNYVKLFPRLEHLDIDFDSNGSLTSLTSLFSQNQQIKKLNLRSRCNFKHIKIPVLTTNLVDLEELHLDVNAVKYPTPAILEMNQFRNLHTLWLYLIPVSKFNDVLTNLSTLNGLKDILLQSDLTRIDDEFSPGQESLIRIATELKQLESFVTVNIDWTCETVIEFVRQANNLISYDFWSGVVSNYIVTAEFIRELAAVRKLTSQTMDRPLNLKMYAMNSHLKQVFNDPDVSRYIKSSK